MWSLFSLLEILISITCLQWCGSLFPFYLSHFFTLTLFRSISVTLWKWVNLTPFLNTRTSTQPLIESSVTKECSPYTVCTVNFYISCLYLTELTCWTNTVKSWTGFNTITGLWCLSTRKLHGSYNTRWLLYEFKIMFHQTPKTVLY